MPKPFANSKVFASPEARPVYARPRTYDIQHIRLEITLDVKAHRISGLATLTLVPINDGFRSLTLDLAADLTVAGVQLEGGKKLASEHRGDRLHVDLGRSYPAGRSLSIVVDYAGAPRRGLYFVGPDKAHPDKPYEVWSQGQDEDSKSWFPCYDSPNDKATSEVIATVRTPFTVVSNGKLLSIQDNRRQRTRTFHWREDSPHPAYLTSIVVGDYEEFRDEVDGVPLLYFVHKPYADQVRRTFGNTPKMMRFFSKAIDYPYPYEKYAQVVVTDFIFGGMENISATTLTDAVMLDETAALDRHCDSLIAHELAHQWWGNLLTCKEWSHAWLNEGFATYFDALFAEHHRGPEEFQWQMHLCAKEYFREDEEKYRRPIVERRYTRPIEIFDRHLYEKGALILHMLRHELGDDLFWKAIRHYARKHQFQNVETSDLKVAIEESTGRHLDGFFDQWVYGPGFPTLDVSWSWNEASRMVSLRVRQTQNRDHGTPLFSLSLEVEVATPKGPERHHAQIDGVEQTLFFPAPGRPRYVRIDPDHWVLKKLKYEPGRNELLAQLEDATDLFGQVDAAEGLGRFSGDAEVLQALRHALRRARFFAVKGAILDAIGRLQGDQARDLLLGALPERDLRARRYVVRALAEFLDDSKVAETLRRSLRREKSYFVRAEILRTLAKIRAPKAFELLLQNMRVASHRDVIRSTALAGMAELEDARGIDVALEWAHRGHSRWTRDAALRTLAKLGRAHPQRTRDVQIALEAALREPSFFASISAADALGKLGRSQAIPALRRLQLSDVDPRIQKAAREAIDSLGTDARSPEAWRSLRSEVREIERENRELRGRVERLEAQLLLNGRPRTQHPKRRSSTTPRATSKRTAKSK